VILVIIVANVGLDIISLPYLTSGVGILLHLPSVEAVLVRPNAHPQM